MTRIVATLRDAITREYILQGGVEGDGPTPYTATSEEGVCTSPEIEPGYYVLRAYATYYQVMTKAITVAEGEVGYLSFELSKLAPPPKYGRVTGTVRDRLTGTGIAAATVEFAETYRTTDSSGNYDTGLISEGDYYFKAYKANYSIDSATITVIADRTVTRDFYLTLITPPPECIEGRIEVLEYCPDAITWKTRRVCRNGKWVSETQTCPTPPPPDKGRISGTVTDSRTTQPIAQGRIFGSGPQTFDVAVVEGEYSSPDIEVGSYSVEASAAGYVTQTKLATVSEGSTTTLDFELEPTAVGDKGKIAGRITDAPTGDPVSDATITIAEATYKSDFDGLYESGDLDPDTYTVEVSATGYYAASRRVDVRAGEVSTANFSLTRSVMPEEIKCDEPPAVIPFFQPLVNAVWWLFCPLINAALGFSKSVSEFFKQISTTELQKEAIPKTKRAATDIAEALDAVKYAHSPMTPEEAKNAIAKAALSVQGVNIGLWTTHALTEALSLGQWEATSQYTQMVLKDFKLDSIVGMAYAMPFVTGYGPLVERYWRKFYRPTLPPEDTVDLMYLRGDIDIAIWYDLLAQYGYNEDHLSKRLRLLGPVAPHEVAEPDEQGKPGWDEKGIIPATQDLINMRVKEKISQKQFERYMAFHKIPPYWTGKMWDAHFIPPTLDDILTAWRRGLIDEAEVDRLMILIDLDPFYKNVFDTRKYEDLPLSLIRFMFETAAITSEQVKPFIHRLGYPADFEDPISTFIIGFQERLWRRRYIMSAALAYEREKVDAAKVREVVREAKFPVGVAEWIIKNADFRREYVKKAAKAEKVKEESLAMAIEMWAYDIWDESDVTDQIDDLGYEEDMQPDILELCRKKMQLKKEHLGLEGAA